MINILKKEFYYIHIKVFFLINKLFGIRNKNTKFLNFFRQFLN